MIAAGSKLGRYEIRSLIGAGGMGEVYLARDPRISRDVAIKVLPASFAQDKDRLARFEQEAQAAGALNHPNILAIYDVDTHAGAPYVVSEFLKGETLRKAMGGAALSVRRATNYALQVAQGLAAAHERGIIHRDLKPENLFITTDGRVKILDFGLAKLTEADGDRAQSDIATRRVDTDPGMIMGTLGYMSPEQLRGRQVDHRSDIFSLGAILYEMLSGKRAFNGESVADLMSAILREDPPDLSESNKSVAPALGRVVNHCLEKNPEQRFHSARDLAFAIEALSGSITSPDAGVSVVLPNRVARFSREMIAWIVAGILLMTSVTLAAFYLRQPAIDRPITRFVVAMPDKTNEIAMPVISPDGRTLVFVATSEGSRTLYTRRMDSETPQKLEGTQDALYPFWSPDSRYIGFFSANKLKKIEATGGPAQTLCDVQSPTGGAWNREGVILFGTVVKKGIYRLPASGGEPIAVTKFDESRKETEQCYPLFLPDGNHFLYYSWNGSDNDSAVFAASLDGKETKLLFKNESNLAYAAPHYLLFARGSTVMAQAFDASKLELSGDSFPVLENVSFSTNVSYSHFSVSDNGVLAFWSGKVSGQQLAWFDHNGKQIALVGPPGTYNDIVLSPDEKRLAIQWLDSGGSDIWLMDLVRGVPSRFTFTESSEDDPCWSPDGSAVVFTSNRDSQAGLYRKNSNGAGSEELLVNLASVDTDGTDWSSDGRYILFHSYGGSGTGSDVWVAPLYGDRKPFPVLQSRFNETQAHFSPDGRWLAYVSNETGRPEVYVQNFPSTGGKWQVSNGGAAQPHWRGDGKELFYITAEKTLMAVEVKTATTFEMGAPVALFQTRVSNYSLPNRYAVSRDGKRFLVNSAVEDTNPTPITVILNWTATLKK
jgi:serine/threonine protein kinase